MQLYDLLVCRFFMHSLSSTQRERLLTFATPELRDQIGAIPEIISDTETDGGVPFGLETSDQLFGRIHPSHIATALRKFTPAEMSLFLAVLPESVAKNVEKRLKITENPTLIPEPMKRFLQNTLLSNLFKMKDQILPLGALPWSTLNILLTFSPTELEEILFFWGLNDFVPHFCAILDERYNSVIKALSPAELDYLQTQARRVKQFQARPFDLAGWSGDQETLRRFVKESGILRLQHLLRYEHEILGTQLIWLLDKQSGDLLFTPQPHAPYEDWQHLIKHSLMELAHNPSENQGNEAV